MKSFLAAEFLHDTLAVSLERTDLNPAQSRDGLVAETILAATTCFNVVFSQRWM